MFSFVDVLPISNTSNAREPKFSSSFSSIQKSSSCNRQSFVGGRRQNGYDKSVKMLLQLKCCSSRRCSCQRMLKLTIRWSFAVIAGLHLDVPMRCSGLMYASRRCCGVVCSTSRSMAHSLNVGMCVFGERWPASIASLMRVMCWSY